MDGWSVICYKVWFARREEGRREEEEWTTPTFIGMMMTRVIKCLALLHLNIWSCTRCRINK